MLKAIRISFLRQEAKSDGNDMQADDSNMDEESDDDMDTKVNPTTVDVPPLPIGSG